MDMMREAERDLESASGTGMPNHNGKFQTRSTAVAKRPRDASCLYSFNTKRRARSFIISCFGFRYTTAYN